LDPFGQYDDAMLWDALKRSHLVEDSSKRPSNRPSTENESDSPLPTANEETSVSRFTLDTFIEEEGANLSLGQVSTLYNMRGVVDVSFPCLAITR
jgi:ATP-binding cassette, subfamily C (CFTR/MRP), member 1